MCSNRISELTVTPSDVCAFLMEVDPNTGMGNDGIHSRLLKMLASDLSVPLAMIFSKSLETGVLPPEWLNAIVVPVYKKSLRYDTVNNRPISLTSIPCKVLEKCIVKHLTE